MSAQAAVKDQRVATAAAHWGPRFVNNGVELGTFEATLARIDSWDDWCSEWARSAEEYERLAEKAEADGNRVTAAQAWLRASLCWHFGKFVFVDDMAQQRAAHERTVACYANGMWSLEPAAERVEIPYGEARLAALLRRPAGSDKPPTVIMIPGLDSTKEELQTVADVLLRRGLATLAVDGPGQGEAEYEVPIEPAYEKPVAAIVDWVVGRDDLDNARIGLYGVSLGGYYAMRAAANESRLRAVVGLAGPYDLGEVWPTLPPQSRAAFKQRSAATSDDQARAKAGELTMRGFDRVICPTLLVHGRLDRIIPYEQAEEAVARVHGLELVTFDDGNHGITNRAFESRSLMADWLANHLAAAEGD